MAYSILTFVVSLMLLAFASELMVRWLVSEETFWPVSNIYHVVDTPSVGYTLRPNWNGVAFGVDLSTNSLGFRGPEWRPEKRRGTFRVALLGDSQGFAYGVAFKESVGERLAAELRRRSRKKCEVLNFCVNGYNTRQQLAVFREHVLPYQPDVIIVIVTSNDHQRALLVDKAGWLYGDVTPSPGTRVHDKSIAHTRVVNFSWLDRKSRLMLYVRLLGKRRELSRKTREQRRAIDNQQPIGDWMGVFPPGPVSERLTDTVYAPLKAIITEARARGVPVVISSVTSALDYRQMIERLSKEEGVATLELLALFPETSSGKDMVAKFSLGWDRHFNSVAHRRWAVGLAELLENHGPMGN